MISELRSTILLCRVHLPCASHIFKHQVSGAIARYHTLETNCIPKIIINTSLIASCSFTEFVDIFDALMKGVFSSVGMHDPLERVLTNEDLDWELNPKVEEIRVFLHS